MKHLRVGRTVPTKPMTAAMARRPLSYRPLQNEARLVNLELVYSPDTCVPSNPQFKSDEGSAATIVMRSYSNINNVTQIFTYGGTDYGHPGTEPYAGHCTPEHNTDVFTKKTTSAATFSVGYTSPLSLFSGSAETGYSSPASVEFDFFEAGYLCGTDATPPNSPGVLEAED